MAKYFLFTVPPPPPRPLFSSRTPNSRARAVFNSISRCHPPTHAHPQGEVENMVDTYMRRGMSREDAQEVSARLAKYDDCFVDAVMVAEGLGSSMFASPPLDEAGSIREGLVTFGSFALSGIVPLLSYALSPLISASGSSGDPVSQGVLFLWACLLTATALFSIGVVKVRVCACASFLHRPGEQG